MSERQVSTRPYWLSGEELCSHCFHVYVQAAEIHCVSCDGPVCPHCVVLVNPDREVLCPVCHVFHPSEGG